MAHIRPFKALRPAPALAHKVAELPYDVMNSEEARILVENNPHSFMRVDRAEVEMPLDTDPHDPRVYAKAREVIERFIAEGTLEPVQECHYYLYQLTMDGRTQSGLVSTVSIGDYETGIVKKHEHTRPDKELDRITHVEVCKAQTGPIFLTFRDTDELARLMAEASSGEPLYDFTAPDGVLHRVWCIQDPEDIQAATQAMDRAGHLYIADGHHRCAAAAAVARNRRMDSTIDMDADHEWFLAVSFPESQVKVLDYNRVVADLNGLDHQGFMDKVSQSFDVRPAPSSPYSPDARHSFGMYLDGTWFALSPKPGLVDETDPIRCLDVSILQEHLLSPILGVLDPRTDKRIDFVGGIRGLDELERRVAQGMKVAFSLYPVSVREMMAVADEGLVMPPKSTWFEPKLRSGLFINPIG